jgi:WhiB family redox-sensing transcriptional regulator
MVVPPATTQPRPACVGLVGLHFGYEGERSDAAAAREERAKKVCARCPIRDACLAGALARREPYGVWGGLTTAERNSKLSRRRRAAEQG